MPINIYSVDSGERIAWLSEDNWTLPKQMGTLETWLRNHGKNVAPGSYVADIGFSIRKDASGGGAVLKPESMSIMGEIGMEVHFSEYP